MTDELHAEHEVEAPPQPAPPSTPARPAAWLTERLAWGGFKYLIPPVANRLPYMLGGVTFHG